MNPFKENPEIIRVMEEFYRKFYNDNRLRYLILGINPGRFGAGATGIPFTDTKRLIDKCGIKIKGLETHEPSSVFIYEMIDAYGGLKKFYKNFYISSICPLGFTYKGGTGKAVNYNYYDNPDLQAAVLPFIIENIYRLIELGINTDVCFCLGTGHNYLFLKKLNDEMRFFKRIIPLKHPRFIIQYKYKEKEKYVREYLKQFDKFLPLRY